MLCPDRLDSGVVDEPLVRSGDSSFKRSRLGADDSRLWRWLLVGADPYISTSDCMDALAGRDDCVNGGCINPAGMCTGSDGAASGNESAVNPG
jgi:hypothetical protein